MAKNNVRKSSPRRTEIENNNDNINRIILQRDAVRVDEDVCVHIFSASSTLVGVCLTVIGIIRVVITKAAIDTIADDLLAGDALIFLIACMLAYWAIHARSRKRLHVIEKLADSFFIFGLFLMVVVCAIIAYALF